MIIAYKAYENYLKTQKLPQNTIERKLSSLRRFDDWQKKTYLKKNFQPIDKSVSEAVKFSPPKKLLSYLYLSLLVLFSATLGIYGYQQIFKEVVQQYAYPQAPSPTTPNRYLSFQARLTDSSDNPITVPTDFRFIVYDNVTASGSAKLWEEQRYIDPDQDGIFSVTLGTETAIPTTLFSENADLWLGVTVETDPEATPRQRIATVGYAINAETLQGFPPSASASADQIPVLTQEGDLVLAQANPMVYSSSGTFSIKGQVLTLTTDTGTNGDIQIAPDGTGNLDINLSSTTQNAVSITNAGQTSGDLIHAYLGNGTATGNLLTLSSGASETNQFTVSRTGQCVTGDSLLSLAGGSTQRIDQIQGGEMVLSLNETTGKLEPQKIKGLLDMGIQPVYKLTTQDGKTIRTTGNHPYLTKNGWTKVIDLEKGEEIAVAEDSVLLNLDLTGNNRQSESNNQYSPRNAGQIQGFYQTHFSAPFNKDNDKYKHNIPYTVNLNKSAGVEGATNAATNQPTAIFDKKSESLSSWEKLNSNSIKSNIKQGVKFVKIASIEYMGEEQVWDIEVANTHNFVANGIIAHNTYISGNLGVGTTNPLQKLHISAGDINVDTAYGYRINNTAASGQYLRGDGTRFVSSAILIGDLPTITSAGGWTDGGASVYLTTTADNVGIGTTSPASGSKLHVEGQCVEENSLIQTNTGSKPIKDIQPGNRVLSLNEQTEKFEYQTVEKTLDMGFKEIYELTTETGKKIETTGNHPYLTKKSAEADLVSLTDSLNDWPDNLETNISPTKQLVKSLNKRGVDLPGVEPGRRGLSDQSSEPAKPAPNSLSQNQINNATWTKVIYLKAGDEIATINGFEKIASIRILPPKHVYDLQIANTHNFVANGIIAHNTYISGNLGIGTTSPVGLLHVAATAPFVITSAGQVGIGTTGPGTKLHVSDGNSLHATLTSGMATWQIASTRQANVNAVGTITSSDSQTERGVNAFLRTRGTLMSPTAVQNNDYLGDLLFGGYDGSNIQYGGGVFGFVDGTPTSGNVPTRISFVTGNNSTDRLERLTIKSSGNVGIGTTGPTSLLHLYNSSTAQKIILERGGTAAGGVGTIEWGFGGTDTIVAQIIGIKEIAGDNDGALGFYTRTAAGSVTEKVRIDSEGNVGIGTTGPSGKLDIVGSGGGQLVVSASDAFARLWFGGSHASVAGVINRLAGAEDLYFGESSDSGKYIFRSSGAMTIEGNVGIGTTGPSAKLDVYGAAESIYVGTGTHRLQLYGGNAGGEYPPAVLTPTNDALRLGTNNAINMRISAAGGFSFGDTYQATDPGAGNMIIQGNVGIGTTGPNTTLHVNSTGGIVRVSNSTGGLTNADLDLSVNSAGLASIWQYGNYNLRFGTNNAARVTIQNDGNVGIGTTGPGEKLDIVGAGGSVNREALRLRDSGNSGYLFAGYEDTGEYGFVGAYKPSAFRSLVLQPEGGNVGIGTTAPSQKLHIAGDMRLTGALYDVNNGVGTSGQILSSTVTGVDWVDISSVGIGGSGTTNYIPIFTASTTLGNSGIYQLSGNVGIGTTGPGSKLQVNGDITIYGGTLKPAYGFTGNFIDLGSADEAANMIGISFVNAASFNDSNDYYIKGVNAGDFWRADGVFTTSGNVGIGTTGPGYPLSIYKSTAGTQTLLNLTSGPGSVGDGPAIEFKFANDSENQAKIYSYATTSGTGDLRFATALGYTYSDRMTILSSGNVGIGTTGPGGKLEIENRDNSVNNGQATPSILLDNDLYFPVEARAFSSNGRVFRLTQGGTVTTATAGNPTITKVSNNYGALDFTMQSPDAVGEDTTTGGFYFNTAKTTEDTSLTTRLFIGTSGNVGIGTVSPGSKLAVSGNAVIGSGYATSAGPTDGLAIQGNVGIGTTGPGANLDISGNNVPTLKLTPSSDSSYYASMNARWDEEAFALIGGGYKLLTTGGYANPTTTYLWSNNAQTMTLKSGNVGIGTTSPGTKLQVMGIGRLLRLGDGTGTNSVYSLIDNAGGSAYYGVEASVGGTSFTGTTANAVVFMSGGTTPLQFGVSNAVKMTILNDGNVGIGTTAPGYKLDVNGTARIVSTTLFQDTLSFSTFGNISWGGSPAGLLVYGASGYGLHLGANGTYSNGMYVATTGNVGIGTTGPNTRTEIVDSNTSTSLAAAFAQIPLTIRNSDTTTNNWTNMGFFGGTGGNLVATMGIQTTDQTSKYGDIVFANRSASGFTEKMRILSTGNVGIGTTGPGAKLDVRGETWLNVMPDHEVEGQIRIGRSDGNLRYHLIKAYNSSTQANNYLTFALHTGTTSTTTDVLTLKGAGNVGIGTTGPTATLQIKGDNKDFRLSSADFDLAYLGYNGVDEGLFALKNDGVSTIQFKANGNSYFNTTGNVGIGTTNPLQKLHVAGNCVTFDTLLPIRRKKRKKNHNQNMDGDGDNPDNQKIPQSGTLVNLTDSLNDWLDTLRSNITTNYGFVKSQNTRGVDLPGVEPGRFGVSNQSSEPAKPTPTSSITQPELDDYDYLLLPISDVLAGDEVMSLDESTGDLKYSRINRLIDMGLKEVYEVTLKSGRTIKTTAEHPFLTKLSRQNYL